MEKTDCRELLEVHRNVIDVESIAFLMILLAPENSFVTLHMRWHKGCFPKASTKIKNRSAMRTWGLMLKFIPFGWNALLKYQYLGVELLPVKG